MRTITISGSKVQYDSIGDLGSAVESTIGTIDARLKKLDTERRTLQRQRRALKAFLGGKEKKAAAQAQRNAPVPA